MALASFFKFYHYISSQLLVFDCFTSRHVTSQARSNTTLRHHIHAGRRWRSSRKQRKLLPMPPASRRGVPALMETAPR